MLQSVKWKKRGKLRWGHVPLSYSLARSRGPEKVMRRNVQNEWEDIFTMRWRRSEYRLEFEWKVNHLVQPKVRKNLWSHCVSQNMNEKLSGFLPYIDLNEFYLTKKLFRPYRMMFVREQHVMVHVIRRKSHCIFTVIYFQNIEIILLFSNWLQI